jgi:cytidylate kinase
VELDYENVAADMAERDTLDSTRDASPLQQADGALVVDTTERSVDEVVEHVLGHLA